MADDSVELPEVLVESLDVNELDVDVEEPGAFGILKRNGRLGCVVLEFDLRFETSSLTDSFAFEFLILFSFSVDVDIDVDVEEEEEVATEGLGMENSVFPALGPIVEDEISVFLGDIGFCFGEIGAAGEIRFFCMKGLLDIPAESGVLGRGDAEKDVGVEEVGEPDGNDPSSCGLCKFVNTCLGVNLEEFTVERGGGMISLLLLL
jgi:hypothetical protein